MRANACPHVYFIKTLLRPSVAACRDARISMHIGRVNTRDCKANSSKYFEASYVTTPRKPAAVRAITKITIPRVPSERNLSLSLSLSFSLLLLALPRFPRKSIFPPGGERRHVLRETCELINNNPRYRLHSSLATCICRLLGGNCVTRNVNEASAARCPP